MSGLCLIDYSGLFGDARMRAFFLRRNLDKSEIGRLCLRWWAMPFTDVQNILMEQHAMLSQQPRSAISEHNDAQRTTYGNDLDFDDFADR